MRKLFIALVVFAAFGASARAQEITTQTPVHANPNFNPSKPMMTIHASSNQTGDLFDFYSPGGTLVCSVTATGSISLCPGGGGGGVPGGSNTQVQFNNSGAFGGSANFIWNNTTNTLTVAGTISASSFVTVGTGAGYTAWTSGPLAPGTTGTVQCGANAASQFACSFNGGAVTLMSALANDLGGTDPTNPQVVGFHLVNEGQTGSSPITFSVANDTTTGTKQYSLAKVVNNSGPAKAILISTSDTSIPVYMTQSATAITNYARLVTAGSVGTCTFDGAGTAGDYVAASATIAGDCHDAGAAAPTSGWVVGQLTSSPAAAGSTGTVKTLSFNAAAGGAVTFQVNGTNLSSQSMVNFASGLGVNVSDYGAGKVAFTSLGVPLGGHCSGVVTASSAAYLFGYGGAGTTCAANTVLTMGYVVPRGGTISDLFVHVGTGTTVAGGDNVTVMVNRAFPANSISCAITTVTTCSDTTHSDIVNAGDDIEFKIYTGASDALADVSVGLDFQ